ncbi:hypothetical protein O6H91_15G020600 [Diphasiastrum complanatum]|uniref:Uncharacterized protein n=1 Tax=Diphasiastrum complanatum TaxID=34168 RepID=A0ACC2BGC0_DIPCM|nr:hypothetical protein O6H91_Y498900 [Diphasiastrum complanatum]KAJ7528795.1 hypothetical protein O6H91_15G020600 [Diphasiastrum complanatum]
MELTTQPKSMKKTITQSLFSKKSGMNILLVVLTALLSSSSGKNVVPSLKPMFMLLASRLHESHEAQHSALFVLVNVIVIAIWIRSSSISPPSNRNPEKKCDSTPLAALPAPRFSSESKGSTLNSLPLASDSQFQQKHQNWDRLEKEQHIGTHFHADRQVAARQHSKGRRRRVSDPDANVQETRLVDPESHSSNIAERHEEILVHKEDLSIERIESFIARHREQWRQQRQESIRKRNQISWTNEY